MADTRELILARLFAVLSAVPGPVSIWRNRGELAEDKRPAIVQLDADEAIASPAVPPQSRGGPVPTMFLRLDPQIFYLLKPSGPKNVNVGQNLNAMRVSILRAVLLDSALISLVGENGKVVYRGCQTDLQTGSSIMGELRIDLSFVYVLNPRAL